AESAAYSMLQAGPEFAVWLADQAPGEPAPPSTEAVLVERDGGVVRLTLNRPDVHNAFDTAMRDALVDTLRAIAFDPSVEGVVLAGAGPSFSSGGDLREFGSFVDPATSHAVRSTRSPAHWLSIVAEAKAVTAELHGSCAGAGI